MAFVNAVVGGYTILSGFIAGEGEQDLGKVNAKALQYQAGQEIEAGEDQARVIRKLGRYAVEAANAEYAASGVRVDQGSPVDVRAQLYDDIAHDAMTAILNGKRKANALVAESQGVKNAAQARGEQTFLSAIGQGVQYGYQGYRDASRSGWATINSGAANQRQSAPLPRGTFRETF